MTSHPLVPVLLYPLYLLLRWLLYGLRELVWRLNGTRTTLNQILGGRDVKDCGQLLKVSGRYKYDAIMQSNKPEDFILYHERFVDSEYVLKDEVSLYCVDRQRVVFVECRTGFSPWDLTRYSFSRQAQHQEAVRVVILPTQAAVQLAERIGKPRDNIVLLGNVSRCGSTLLCRMFQSTAHYISYIEPSALGDLLNLADPDDPDTGRIISTTLTLLCKPCRSNPAIEGHVIKVTACQMNVLESLYKRFPEAKYLFVYRNPVAVAKSLARLVPSLPYNRMLSLLSAISERYERRFSRYHNRVDEPGLLASEQHSAYGRILPTCLRPVTTYHHLLQLGLPIAAVSFEDLIHDPELCMRRVFAHCRVPEAYIPRALIPLDRDAQENSALAGDRLKQLPIPEFTERDRAELERLCGEHGIANIIPHRVYTGTISSKA